MFHAQDAQPIGSYPRCEAPSEIEAMSRARGLNLLNGTAVGGGIGDCKAPDARSHRLAYG